MAGERHGAAIWAAICRTTNVAHFDAAGHVVWASERYCTTFGYQLEDLLGMPHRAFCSPEVRASADYRQLWLDLALGRAVSLDCTRIGRDGRELRLHADYDPLLDDDGAVCGFVKVASERTAPPSDDETRDARLVALDRSHAVIDFTPDGIILDANARFLALTGYDRDDLIGRHHRILCDPVDAGALAYTALWARLAAGESEAGVLAWIDSKGAPLWLQASYTPVADADGTPQRIVAIATDVTRRVRLDHDVAARHDEVRRHQAAIADKTGEMQATMTQLAALVDAMTAMSRQTELMAINAAIDAARAGEPPATVIRPESWRPARRR
ncbi:methyl-accepting chemotaxis protein [Sphingomonas sp. RIT328]|uniref:methyl-accepting chemotaxis protein n=1 Tax=Sphingomonas sp. RIT328 TaxID=1470591 RepID=UPI0004467655|nr:PAS domain-containing methyl-accepting chemotaxis protein [Sphingomonas sp. RIT328]EZP57296.1 Sensory box protein [Sphingomonas sp. RIT328]